MLNGFSRPPLRRRTASDRLRFQRQRAVNIGLRRTACPTASCTLWGGRKGGTVSRGEGGENAVIACSGLQLEVEVQAELLAKAKPERSVDPGAERRVDDQLHPAALLEASLDRSAEHTSA